MQKISSKEIVQNEIFKKFIIYENYYYNNKFMLLIF